MLIRRRIAGLIAVCAFALSYGEALTAATCSMGTSAEMAMAMELPMEGHGQPTDEGPVRPDECPLSMPGSPANCIFSSAVAPALDAFAAPLAGQMVKLTAPEDHYQLLLDHSAFHPPKA